MPSILVHGVYEVKAPDPCCIVEITIRDSEEELEFSKILYDVTLPRHGSSTQAPFNEHFISLDGEKVLGDFEYGWDYPEVWCGDVRIVFLMHFLMAGKEIKTPYGPILVPEITSRPDRLKKIKYKSPY